MLSNQPLLILPLCDRPHAAYTRALIYTDHFFETQMTKPTITAFKRSPTEPELFFFGVYFTLGETGGMLVPGFRIRDSLAMPPVYRYGSFFNRTVHLSTTTAAEIVDEVSPLFEEATGTSLLRDDSVKFLQMKPQDVYLIAPDLLTENQTEDAKRRLASRLDPNGKTAVNLRKEAKDLKRAANRAAHAEMQAAKEAARRTPGVLAFLEGPTL